MKNVIAITEISRLISVDLEVFNSISKNQMEKFLSYLTNKKKRIWGNLNKCLESVKRSCGIVHLYNCRFFMAGRSVVDFETIDTQSFNNLLSDSQSPKWRLLSG